MFRLFFIAFLVMAHHFKAYSFEEYDYENDPFLKQEAAASQERKVIIKDPLESLNKTLLKAFMRVDKYAIRPIALAYGYVTPQVFRRGVINVANNLGTPEYVLAGMAIGGGERVMLAVSRFSINSTFGVLGFSDVANEIEMPEKNTTLPDVLRYYGSPEGFLLFTPLGILSPPDFSSLAFNVAQDSYFGIGLWGNILQLLNNRREYDSQLQTLYSLGDNDEIYSTLKMIKYTQIKNWNVQSSLRKENTNKLRDLMKRSPSAEYSI